MERKKKYEKRRDQENCCQSCDGRSYTFFLVKCIRFELVRSGFSASKALFFNFLLALVALVGTAMALLLGQDPGQSALMEGFTVGGFIYIAVAGVLAEMNNYGSSTLKRTAVQLTSLIMGMAVALCISLVE